VLAPLGVLGLQAFAAWRDGVNSRGSPRRK